uniref:hypothetical protein n=1 Tax=Flavobacterium sp. TaxID=239 RepID=UPI004048DFC1
MNEHKEKIISDGKLAKLLALLSFSIGTFLLVLFYITKNEIIIIIGFYYVITALLFNSIVFINLIFNLIVYKTMYWFQLKSTFILLLNIPITLLYLKIVFQQL